MPYCPVCGLESAGESGRCPLDRAFYVESRCPKCDGEVFAGSRYCGHCGDALPTVLPQTSAVRLAAGAHVRALAFLVDLLILVVGLQLVSEVWFALPLYFVILESGGRQTVGQHLFRLVVLDLEGKPLSVWQALRRFLLLLFPWARRWRGRVWRVPD